MNIFRSTVVTVGLAIFSMFFGAGNLMYPIKAGFDSGQFFTIGLLGFLITTVLLPVLGLVSIILFNGNYREFFGRIGTIPGALAIAFSMAVMGPFIAMPRTVTLSHTMLEPFLNNMSLVLFSIIFCALTFLVTYKENKVIQFLSHIISPALLGSLGYILIKAIANPQPIMETTKSAGTIFYEQAVLGYAHLDLFGGIFFASMIINLLKKNLSKNDDYNIRTLALTCIKGSFVSAFLLAIIYIGLFFLGSYYGPMVQVNNLAKLFSAISFAVVGCSGAFAIAIAVALACFSTIVALAMVLAEYIHKEVTRTALPFLPALALVLTVTAGISCYGLDSIMYYSAPFINTGYPVLITITVCNLAYKLFNFTPIKVPVLLTLIGSVYMNFFM